MRPFHPALRIPVALALAAAPAAAGDTAPAWPQHVLDNGKVRMTVFLPDTEKGFYRGPRFDGSGLIAHAECGGHAFYGPWKTPHDPAGNDCAIGPAEEFGMTRPVGYDEAAPGGLFLKIGVGLLEKETTDETVRKPSYGFWKPYVIAKPGTWKIAATADAISFEQSLSAPGGCAYRYTKRIVLVPGAAAFTIHRRLENTGGKPIVTDHYNHNFTIIDDVPIGPDYRVVYPFDPEAKAGEAPPKPPVPPLEAKAGHSLTGFAEPRGRELVFTAELPPGKAIHAHLLGFPAGAPYAFAIENRKTGAAVRVRGERPLSRAAIYAVRTAVCPEPFIDIDIAPGAALEWKTEYTFDVGIRNGAGKEE